MARHPLYSTWHSMLQRCENPRAASFKYYGARGISVCPEWHDFETFARDMGERPDALHSLDRIDGESGYSRENCRWSTWSVQNNNKRKAPPASPNEAHFRGSARYPGINAARRALFDFMVRNGISYREAAEGLDVTAQVVRMWFTYASFPNALTIRRIHEWTSGEVSMFLWTEDHGVTPYVPRASAA